jgi:type I restriction enzyme S subunit
MNWEKVKISDFTSVITGGTPSTTKTEYWENGHIPWLNSGALNQEIITDSENFITQAGLENSSTRMMPKDTILIALTGTTTGVVGYLSFEACANQSVTGILPSNKHHPKFLYYYLKSIREQILEASYGGAQKHISQAFVKELLIPLPPLATQKRIADILDTADALRRKDQELLTKYDQLAQAIFIDMFGDPVKNEKGWEVKTVREIVANKKHSIKAGPFGSSLKKEFYVKSGYKIYGQEQVIADSFEIGDYYITEEKYQELENCKIETDDILISLVGSYGKISVVPKKFIPGIINPRLMKLSLNLKIYNPYFFKFLLQTEKMKLYVSQFSRGGTMDIINSTIISEIDVIVPNLNLQNQFIEILNNIYLSNKKINNSHSTSLFSSLIQQAFNGTLVS